MKTIFYTMGRFRSKSNEYSSKMAKNFFYLIFILCLLTISNISAQTINFGDSLVWGIPVSYGLEGQEKEKSLSFFGAQYNSKNSAIPFYSREIMLPKGVKGRNVSLLNAKFVPLSLEEEKIVKINDVNSTIDFQINSGIIQKKWHNYLNFSPVRKNSMGQLEKLVYFEVQISYSANSMYRNKSLSFATESALSSGTWFKIATTKRGIYKLNYSFLKKLGVDLDVVDPRNIKLYGYGGGMLPINNEDLRPDDLMENSIYVFGESDGVFNETDYLAFYGEEQLSWNYDSTNQWFKHKIHTYSDTVFYFLNVDGAPGKRIKSISMPSQSANQQVSSYNDYAYYEKDEHNLLKSGSMWFGEVFDNKTSYSFSFDFPNIDNTSPGVIIMGAAARAGVDSKISVSTIGATTDVAFSRVYVNSYTSTYADYSRGILNFTPNSSLVNINLLYNKPQVIAKAWLDYIDINVRRNLKYSNSPIFFRDVNSVGIGNVSEFSIQTTLPLTVWDITDKKNIVSPTINSTTSQLTFVSPTDELKEFVAFRQFDSLNVYPKGKVANQNLHGMDQADMLIVTHPLFLSQANQLAAFHRAEGLSVNVATTIEVYNEYASGAQDPIAIRSFAKMFYDRANTAEDMPQYLLLYGDASYDFKDRFSGNTNYVVSYESANSIDPIESYVSDDFMGLLDDSEGDWPSYGTLDKIDIGIGRLPVKSVREAEGVLQKIVNYSNTANNGDWSNQMVFVADDGDGFLHMEQARSLTDFVEKKKHDFNLEKIFMGAYQKEFTSTGPRVPEMSKKIDQAVRNGALIVNYTGHGGETGWTEERVLDISTINAWKNNNHLPLFVTATCEFSRFDDPLRTSAGELVLLNPNGGGIALLTTTRLVYANQNYLLNISFYNRLFQKNANGEYKRLGQIAMEVKNDNANQANTRKFGLLGDPALKLAFPKYEVKTSNITRGDSISTDTAFALSSIIVSGFVADENGIKMTNFNGTLTSAVFDKPKTISVGNNGIFKFQVQEARIFKGKATVKNGDFSFQFIVPKDIDYDFGLGKISYFAENGAYMASGAYDSLIIGGSNPNAIVDNEGPEIDIYMNDRSFVYGGITNDQPILIADLSDSLGINTVGNGIGHDLIAILDKNTNNTIVLNDFYQANKDEYRSGQIRFPMDKLANGKHTITLKAWDVANNSSEKTIEFTVENEKEVKIGHLVNYPNPFSSNTEFIFEHNQPGMVLDVKIQIFTVSGKLVKSIDKRVVDNGFLSRDLKWDGRDDFGDKIAKGVYVYRLKVRSSNGSRAEKIEKLVIL